MRDKLIDVIASELKAGGTIETASDKFIAALPDMVVPLVWHKSNIQPWDGDYHTVPTAYSVRGLGNESYQLQFDGGFFLRNSPEQAMNEAGQMHTRRIMSALGITDKGEGYEPK